VFLLVILTVFSLLGVSFRVILLPPITSYLAENTVNDTLSALDHDQLVAVAEMGRAYVAGDRGAEMPVGDDERTAFPPDVVSHMVDVRIVIQGAFIFTLAVLFVWLVILICTGRMAGRKSVSFGLFLGGIMAVALTLVLTIFGAVNFDALFTSLHELFFADGTWTFAEDSLLICAYPLQFWIGMAVFWALALVILSAVISVIGFSLGRKAEKPSTGKD
jgi:integral membrane protein (TIGR01906 family)